MNCPACSAALPDGARFCYSCGRPIAPPPPPPPAAPAVPAGPALPKVLNCPSCGAPITPTFGDMVVTCEYCGGSVSLGGNGWKGVGQHTMLLPKVTTPDGAAPIVQRYLDQGFLHRKAYEESNILEERLSFVPFWIVPASATTNYSYTDVAVGVGATVGSLAAAEVLGSALGGNRRGGFVAVPMMMGSPVNSTRQSTVTGQYQFPVVAVRSLSEYQPKNYKFRLEERVPFDRKQVPAGAPILNGDLGEDAAAHSAKAFVTQLQTDLAHKQHSMVSKLDCQVEVSEAELLHAPIWYFTLERKGQKTIVLIDSHAGEIMQTVGG
jgi:hypothetical protein